MTIEEAVEILNRVRYQGEHQWYVGTLPFGEIVVLAPNDGRATDEFTAIAIAEKYQREAAFRRAVSRFENLTPEEKQLWARID